MNPNQHPNFLVPIALFGWIPVVVGLFFLLPAKRAAIAAFVIAWLFLPVYGYQFEGLPDYTKMSATALGVLMATVLFASDKVFRFRPRWFDIPMLAWCLVAFPSSMVNGFGPYEGATMAFYKFLEWGLPYFIGRALLKDLDGLRDLAVGIFIGGLVYVPFCLWEIRMSPNLHYYLYGFQQHSFAQTWRGGWRPVVFMQHGLMVGMFMCMAGLVGFYMWRTRAKRVVVGLPMALATLTVLAVAVWCRSTGATFLLLSGIALFTTLKYFRWNFIVTATCLAPIGYMALRTLGGWDGHQLVELARGLFGIDRADSLAVRLQTETDLWRLTKNFHKSWLGFGRFNVIGWGGEGGTEEGRQGIVPDGLWVIALGVNGLVGLAALAAAMTVPVLVFLRRFPVRVWRDPRVAPGAALAVMLALYFIDCVFNAMINPVFFVALGAVGGASTMRLVPETTLAPEDGLLEPMDQLIIAGAAS